MAFFANSHGKIYGFAGHGAALEFDIPSIRIDDGVALVKRTLVPLFDVFEHRAGDDAMSQEIYFPIGLPEIEAQRFGVCLLAASSVFTLY
jgi:hypothetical protein